MDVVYLCRPGENEELRYSLRSLVNMPHDQVWIFGGAPDWVRGLRWYQLPQWGTKHETTLRNLTVAIDHPEVSDPFILMNDDFYIMRRGGIPPVANRGTVRQVLTEYRDRRIESVYTRGMQATLDRLEQHGYRDPLSFELHMPLVVYKQKMREALDLLVGLDVPHKRTAYGAVAGLRGRKLADVKVYRAGEPIPTGRFLSSQDDSFHLLSPTLHATFPEPSRYEA